MADHEHDIEILGQKLSYPKTVWGVLTTVSVVAAVCVIAYVLTVKAKPENIHGVSEFFFRGEVTSKTSTLPPSATYSIGFWTPSEDTATFWADHGGADKNNRWETQATEKKNIEFGELLTQGNGPVRGYRRFKIWGQGRGTLKPGYWWVAGIDVHYPPKYITREYVRFWGAPDSVYVEVVSPKASYVRPQGGEQKM